MKIDPLSAIVSLALAMMSGAVLSHWAGLGEHIELARNTAVANPGQSIIQPMTPQPWMAVTGPSLVRTATNRPMIHSDASDTDHRMLNLFDRMQDQQEELRDQVAEANRDLMELQFQVDTHSQSFRPLRATQEPNPSAPSGPGVLPPIDAP